MLDRSRRGSMQLPSGQLHGISSIFTPTALCEYKATLSALHLAVLAFLAVAAGAAAATAFVQCEFACTAGGFAWDVSVQFSWPCGC